MYTVKRLSELAGITIRTLHYYDEIDLLKPSRVGANGYRHYDENALLRLQQILFYREMGMELMEIKEILDSPDFDLLAALRSHRTALEEKLSRLQKLVHTVDETIRHIAGEIDMSDKQFFEAFSEEQQEEYTRLAWLEYGPDLVNESVRRWKSYTKAQQQAILAEAGQIYTEIAQAMESELSPQSVEVQAILQRWHENLRYFYEPTLDVLRGLGEHYNAHPEFNANFAKLHADLPAYLQEAITQYVDDLEYAEIERLLAEDDEAAADR
jgi:MerR family transcriptional regulator, thiopeptide resistance regulator